MTALPAQNAYRNAVNQGVGKQAFEDLRDFTAQLMGGAAESELTIAAGVVTPISGLHSIDTEADAATDDLDTIQQTNLQDGQLLTITLSNAARLVRVRHNQGAGGKILLQGGAHFTLRNTSAFLLLKRVGTTWVEMARFVGPWRERLTANQTYYVRTDGNDANDGLANTAGGAWLTPTKAWNTIRDTLDLNGFVVTVQLADGTYTAGLSASGIIVGAVNSASVVFQGNAGTPGNVIVNTTAANAIAGAMGARFTVQDMELRTTTSGNCISSIQGAFIAFTNIRFGVCAGPTQILAGGGGGATVAAVGNYSITGAAARHWYADTQGQINCTGRTITITGTPAFSAQFAFCGDVGLLLVNGNTFSGSATGQRYNVVSNGVIQTAGGGASYLPGNAVGAFATGGQYV